MELFTDGGDAEIGRRLAEEVRLLRKQHGRDVWFLGKTLVASAGVTVMAAFPKDKRWLTLDAALLIHGRRMVKDLHLEGPLGSCRRVLEEMIADIDHGLRLEERGFAELIDGSNVDAEARLRRLVPLCRGGFQQRPCRGSRIDNSRSLLPVLQRTTQIY